MARYRYLILQKILPYTFTGKITDIKGAPVNAAAITIWEADAGVPGRYTATTNASGVYSNTIDPGVYTGA
jgi:protocatechuate 3,4-dioxygenase beta subunit